MGTTASGVDVSELPDGTVLVVTTTSGGFVNLVLGEPRETGRTCYGFGRKVALGDSSLAFGCMLEGLLHIATLEGRDSGRATPSDFAATSTHTLAPGHYGVLTSDDYDTVVFCVEHIKVRRAYANAA